MRKIILLAGVVAVAMIAAIASKTFAHCDTLEGPVIQEARTAFETKDVTPLLKWVPQKDEGAVKAAFEKALRERARGADLREKADMEFFEMLVRIHRESEGAPFIGIKSAGAIEPIELEADKALEAGSVDGLTAEMAEHLTHGVKERFERALDKKKRVNDSVEAGREYVEAYVEYLHYVEGIHKAVSGGLGHHDEEADAEVEQ